MNEHIYTRKLGEKFRLILKGAREFKEVANRDKPRLGESESLFRLYEIVEGYGNGNISAEDAESRINELLGDYESKEFVH